MKNTTTKATARLLVPEIMKERGISTQELIWGARISTGTAYHLAKGRAERISFDVLAALCVYFKCQPGDLFELNA